MTFSTNVTNVTLPIFQKTICGSTCTVNIEQAPAPYAADVEEAASAKVTIDSGSTLWEAIFEQQTFARVPCAVSTTRGGHIVRRQIIFAANVAFAVIWLSPCPYITFYTFSTPRTNYLSRQTFVLKTSKL